MNRLWVRLTLAFVVVAVIGIGLASLLANLAIDNEFRSFVARSEANLQNSDLAATLVNYYTEHQRLGWCRHDLDPQPSRRKAERAPAGQPAARSLWPAPRR